MVDVDVYQCTNKGERVKKATKYLTIILAGVLLFGCGARPIKREVVLPDQVIGQVPSKTGNSRLVIFNDSNMFLYGIDGSDKINVSLDGKGVGQLEIGQFLIVETTSTSHVIDLMHWDLLTYESVHKIDISEPEVFLKIYSKLISNGAEIVSKPKDFSLTYESKY